MKRKFLRVLITMAIATTMTISTMTPMIYAEQSETQSTKVEITENKDSVKEESKKEEPIKEEVKKEEVKKEESVKDEANKKDEIKDNIKEDDKNNVKDEEKKDNTKLEVNKDNIESNNKEETAKKVPVELWESNWQLIEDVCGKTGKENIGDVTYDDLKKVKVIQIPGNQEKIPDIIGEFENLVWLNLYGNYDVKLPQSISKLKNLKELNIGNMNLKSLPSWLTELTSLEHIDFSYNPLNKVPDVIVKMENLKYIEASECNINSIPQNVNKLNKLISLELAYNNISSLPEQLYEMKSLRYLGLESNKMQEIPLGIFKLEKLEDLILARNSIISIPDQIINMHGDKIDFSLDIRLNQIANIPKISNQNIICNNNFVPSYASGIETGSEVRLKEKVLELKKGELVTQDKLRSVIQGFTRISFNETKTFDIDSRHNIEFVIDGKVFKSEDIAKLKDGVYKAQLKLEKATLDNKNAITTDFINIKVGDAEIGNDDDKPVLDPDIPDNATGLIPYENWQNCTPLMMFTTAYLGVSDIREVTYEDLKNIEFLVIANQGLNDLPKIVEQYTSVKEVYISGNNFKKVPDEIFKLKDIQTIFLSSNNIKELPKELEGLESLKDIYIDDNDINNISCDFSEMKKLDTLYLSDNPNISSQLNKIYNAKSISYLSLENCNLYNIDYRNGLIPMKNLRYVNLSNNQIVGFIDAKGFQLDMYNNFFFNFDGYNKQLKLKENKLDIERNEKLTQEELRKLVEVKGLNLNDNETLEELNKNHNITFVINNNEYTVEQIAKLKVGKYKAKLKIEVADMYNTTTMTDKEIDLTVSGKDDPESINPNVTDNKNPNVVENKNPNNLPKTGGASAAAVAMLGLGATIGGAGLLKKKKEN